MSISPVGPYLVGLSITKLHYRYQLQTSEWDQGSHNDILFIATNFEDILCYIYFIWDLFAKILKGICIEHLTKLISIGRYLWQLSFVLADAHPFST